MVKTLIIGGSRFLGPRLIELLIQKGHEITVFNRGTDYGQNLPDTVSVVHGDRNNDADLAKVFAGEFDYIYDTCCYDTGHAEKVLSYATKGAHLVLFSTAAVYAKPSIFPVNEDAPLGAWDSFGTYGEDKADAERLFTDFAKQHKGKVTIFRPTYMLGDNNYFDRENYYFSRIEAGLPILVPGNGNALMQFAFLEETAQAFANIPDAQKDTVEILNVGGNEYISTNDLVGLCSNIVGKPANIVHVTGLEDIQEEAFYDDLYPFPNLNFIVSNHRITSKYDVQFLGLEKGIREVYESWKTTWDGKVKLYDQEKEVLKRLGH